MCTFHAFQVEMCAFHSNQLLGSSSSKVFLSKDQYSRARLIRTAHAQKNCANYLSMQIIRAYVTLRFYQQQSCVQSKCAN